MRDERLFDRFVERARLALSPTLQEIVEAIRAIPHGRPRQRSARGVLEDWRGTCSTKHLLLKALRPDLDVRFTHRIFRLTPDNARRWLGPEVTEVVPPEGMIDVHTYATALIDGRRIVIDVTFPGGEPWDGISDMAIPFPEGEDVDAGEDPIASKDALISKVGDTAARQRLIAALSVPPA